MRSQSSLLYVLIPLALLVVSSAAITGGWSPIKDLKDPHLKEIGEFAVSKHNEESKTNLKFQEVVGGESQVVAGFNYRLILKVTDGAASKNYEAVVHEKPSGQLDLISFNPAH